ncbi:MAG: hypothetical protein AB1757_13785 [Acidobacteriota bacterium]
MRNAKSLKLLLLIAAWRFVIVYKNKTATGLKVLDRIARELSPIHAHRLPTSTAAAVSRAPPNPKGFFGLVSKFN